MSPATVRECCKASTIKECCKEQLALKPMLISNSKLTKTDQVTNLSNSLRKIHDQLISEPSLEPSPSINKLYSELVRICSAPTSSEVYNHILNDLQLHSIINTLRSLASEGEYFLERHWTYLLINKPVEEGIDDVSGSQSKLEAFPYYQNYVDLARAELHAIAGSVDYNHPPFKRIAFIGSGPLPLSAIITSRIAHRFPFTFSSNLEIHAVDFSKEACILADSIITNSSTNQSHTVKTVHGCATSIPLSCYDLIHIAALVGSSCEEKLNILKRIAKDSKSSTIIVIRSAEGMRRILYPPVEPDLIRKAGLELLGNYIPHGDVVNSVMIAYKP